MPPLFDDHDYRRLISLFIALSSASTLVINDPRPLVVTVLIALRWSDWDGRPRRVQDLGVTSFRTWSRRSAQRLVDVGEESGLAVGERQVWSVVLSVKGALERGISKGEAHCGTDAAWPRHAQEPWRHERVR